MAKEKAVWAIARVEIYPNGDISTQISSVASTLTKAYDLLDKEVWYWIKEQGFAVKDEINALSRSTVVLENNSELRRIILTFNRAFLQ